MRTTHGERKALWRGLGMWLLLGLELELAADIIGSVVSPMTIETAWRNRRDSHVPQLLPGEGSGTRCGCRVDPPPAEKPGAVQGCVLAALDRTVAPGERARASRSASNVPLSNPR